MLEALLRRDRIVIAAALVSITALAWLYLLWLSSGMTIAEPEMSGMNMPGMDMAGMLGPDLTAWDVNRFAVTFVMWAIMMVGMMVPSAAPMILIYAAVGRQALRQGKPFAATGWFLCGYLAVWALFALLATAAQFLLTRAALLDPMMASASRLLGGIILLAAGIYQWTPLKDVCLSSCQSPLSFIQRQGGFRHDPLGAMTMGLRHGAYCVGCCWALLALLFVVGVMNLVWIAVLSAFVLAEKILPHGRLLSRIAGALFIAAGAWFIAT